MEPTTVWKIATNPAWRPFTEADQYGYIGLGVVAAILVGLTIWTYRGSGQSTPRRITMLVTLRLMALVVAILVALRPAASITEIPKLPSTLIVVLDSSESMTIKDEPNSTRWETVQQALSKSEELFNQLKNDQQVTVYVYHFNKDFSPNTGTYDAQVVPNGKATDFATMLDQLYIKHQSEPLLRGMIVLSDGADNGTKPALQEALRWRGIGCPIYTFAVGQSSTTSKEKDVALTSISPDPSPVPIKSELKIKGKINAQGFEGSKIKVRMLIDGEIKATEEFPLPNAVDNEIEFTTKAPEKPGEVKVSLELVDPPLNQVTDQNDRIDTFLTVTKEGVRVLVIAKSGWELKHIRRALASDTRIDYVEAIRSTTAQGTIQENTAFDIQSQNYDVVIIGDVAPEMLTAVRPTILNELKEMVLEKGLGFMMTGGAYSFAGTAGIPGANGWKSTPIAEILPVILPAFAPALISETTAVYPTEDGWMEYITRLELDGQKNRTSWELLNTEYLKLRGYSDLGQVKAGGKVLIRANNATNGAPLLVSQEIGNNGRVLAFGASDTYYWTQPGPDPQQRKRPAELHERFWKQTVLWLAHQDELEGNLLVRPEYRRIVQGGQQIIRISLKDKQGDEIKNPDFRFQILKPGENANRDAAQKPDPDPRGGGKVQLKVQDVGEFTVVAWGEGLDPKGEKIADDGSARYVVYPDISDELIRPAANPDFLLKLENSANGSALDAVRRADRLSNFLETLIANPPTVATPKPKSYPDWRRDQQKWFLPLVLVIFTAILVGEWALRRLWGMV
ncbi:MAG: glutamine amidotransferase [Zavarzinella sp.]